MCRKKQLTNTRASGSDESLRLTPAAVLSLEQSLEFIADDELCGSDAEEHPAEKSDAWQG